MIKSLTEKYGMDATQRQERKEFLGISPQDEQAVAELRGAAEQFAAQFAQGFYRHLLEQPATARFLEDPELVARLKQEQMRYFRELVSGDYGEQYFERRLRVGEAHERVGLEPSWYLGAYNQYIQLCFPHFAEATGGRANDVRPFIPPGRVSGFLRREATNTMPILRVRLSSTCISTTSKHKGPDYHTTECPPAVENLREPVRQFPE